ncbi:MAG: polysaccharide deacetylase family protein [Salinisphaeraceae bacterium]|nr:polysaccharide deacetylase family protein [Salinisphaeraceae bacterium]
MTRAQALLWSWAAITLALCLFFGPSWLTLGLPTLIFLILMHDGVFRPASPWFMPVVTHGPRDGQKVALSFDDGPDVEVTPQVLDALAEYQAKASFFVIGQHVEAEPAITQRIVAEGHELGNHSYAHSRLLNFRGEQGMRAEIEKAMQVLRSYQPVPWPPLYRPPVGLKNPPLAKVVQTLGLKVIVWSLHSRDTRSKDPQRIADRVLAKVKPGDIILMHDGHDLPSGSRPTTAPALRLILAGLQARGLQVVTVSSLLADTP